MQIERRDANLKHLKVGKPFATEDFRCIAQLSMPNNHLELLLDNYIRLQWLIIFASSKQLIHYLITIKIITKCTIVS